MARPSNRTAILEAAIRVAQRDGISGLTLEATAEEAGLTRGGITYHFPSRDSLNLAIQEYLAAEWEASLEAIAGRSAAECTPTERLVAYTRASAESVQRAHLILLLESAVDPAHEAPWIDVDGRWVPSAEDARTDPRAFELFVARLLADGLWSFESITGERLGDDLRTRLVEHMVGLLERSNKS